MLCICVELPPQASRREADAVMFVQVSFVNSICTLKGGTHVKVVIDQICKCAPPPRKVFNTSRSSRCTYRAMCHHSPSCFVGLLPPQEISEQAPGRGDQQEEQEREGERLHGEEPPVGVRQLPDREPSF